MNTSPRIREPAARERRAPIASIPTGLGSVAARFAPLAAACLMASRVAAQDAVVAPVAADPIQTVLQRQAAPPPLQNRPVGPPDTPFQYGALSLRPHLTYRYLYSRGLPAEQGRYVNSEINLFSPGLLFDVGERWSLDYTPTWTSYTARSFRDSVDHAASLRGATLYRDWLFLVSEDFATSSPILLDTAQQTRQRTWATALGATYNFDEAWLLQLGVSLNERYTDVFPDTRDWSTVDWLTHRLSSRFDVAVGVGSGRVEITGQDDMRYERYLGRIGWRPGDKLTFGLEGGVDVRHTGVENSDTLRNPLLQASLEYQLFDVTKLSFAHSRTVNTSYFQAQVTESSGWSADLEQRLLGHFFLKATFRHDEVDFISLAPVPPADRSDTRDAIDLRLTTQLFRRWTVAAIYRHGKNDSNQPEFAFSTSQCGLELRCRY